MDVSVIMVNYFTSKLTFDAIKSFKEKSSGFSYEIVVVDNSNDATEYNKLKSGLDSDVVLVNANANLGFGKGNNLGVANSKGDYLYFMNNDVILMNNTCYELLEFLKNNPEAGIAGSNIYTPDEKPFHSYDMEELSLEKEKKYNSFINIVKRKFIKKRKDFNYTDKPLEVYGCVVGASFMMSRADYLTLGGFEPRIFMYAEESLLCYQVRNKLNKKLYNVPSSKLIHFEGGSSNKSDNFWRMLLDGTYLYYVILYGVDYAQNYIVSMNKIFKKKLLFAKLTLNKERQAHYKKMIEVYNDKLNKMNKRILVTGVKGQLGYDCVRELAERGYTNVKGIDIDDLDLTKEEDVKKYINEYKPEVVMHNAAWTAVDKAEEMPDKVYAVNALAPKYIAEACKMVGAKMIQISTDYVFDGLGDKPFEVDCPKKGLSVYGKTKAQGEDFVISTLDKYFIVRISWVFGKNGNNFVKTMLKLADMGKTELNVVCDQIGSVTYTYDLSKLLCDMIETDKYGIYHATNEGFISWADFAKEIFKEAGKDVKVNPVTTEEYLKLMPQQAKRPLNSRMSKKSLTDAGFNLLPDWKDALKRYLKEIE